MDVAPSTITKLLDRVRKRNIKNYITRIKLIKVRAFEDQELRFDFPVTALIGTNGGGKSTALGAAAMAYKECKPSQFFPKATVGDDSMADWRIDYELVDKDKQPQGTIQRNARFTNLKWRRDDLLERPLVFLPIQRTVPAGEQSRYRKFIGITPAENPHYQLLSANARKYAGAVLGASLSNYKVARLDEDDVSFIFVGERRGVNYSQFHFGAGEASIIQMIDQIENSSEHSLILIEEIENGLHPLAAEQMVLYLIDAAFRKKLQIIFTTHSEHALKNMPAEGIWACIDGRLQQGKLSIDSLRAITGRTEKKFVLFTEDNFAKDWLEDALRQCAPDKVDETEVHAVGGFPYVLQVQTFHNSNPAVSKMAFAIIDGDANHEGDLPEGTAKLPGEAPEEEVFGFIFSSRTALSSLVQQRCQIPHISQDRIIAEIERTNAETTDHHQYFERLGQRLGFASELIIRRGFISIYNEHNKSQFDPIMRLLESD